MTTMSKKQFVLNEGNLCPNCNSDQTEGEDLNINGASAAYERFCNDCEASWTDNYLLTGYSELEVPDLTAGG